VQQLLEKMNREKNRINDVQQKLISTLGTTHLVTPIPDISMLSLQELYENEQLIINDNKLLEVIKSYFFENEKRPLV
jgi:hypothetical protein